MAKWLVHYNRRKYCAIIIGNLSILSKSICVMCTLYASAILIIVKTPVVSLLQWTVEPRKWIFNLFGCLLGVIIIIIIVGSNNSMWFFWIINYKCEINESGNEHIYLTEKKCCHFAWIVENAQWTFDPTH